MTVLLAAVCSLSAAAQTSGGAYTGYSPYSIYGVGDLYRQGTAYSKSMGGVGIAGRDRRYINLSNPAAITARDTLAFMADFGMSQNNSFFRQGSLKSANNTFNINNFAFSVPIWGPSAMVFGVTPYSSVGFDFSKRIKDPALIGNTGSIEYSSSGSGGIYQIFAGAAVTFWDRLSVGGQALFYLGNIDKDTDLSFDDPSYRDLTSGYTLNLNGFGGKFGIQYEQPIKDMYLTVGATYKLSNPIRGYVTGYKYGESTTKTDTLYHHIDTLAKSGNVRLADEIGVGFSIRKPEKWSLEINWIHSGWGRAGLDGAAGFGNIGLTDAGQPLVFAAKNSNSWRAGFEYIPNRNDIRYYMRRCAYRVGTYYDTSYYTFDGSNIYNYGVTFGITLPVSRYTSGVPLYNSVTLGVDVGRRGSHTGNLVSETYVMFVIGFSIHDMWFIKQLYD